MQYSRFEDPKTMTEKMFRAVNAPLDLFKNNINSNFALRRYRIRPKDELSPSFALDACHVMCQNHEKIVKLLRTDFGHSMTAHYKLEDKGPLRANATQYVN